MLFTPLFTAHITWRQVFSLYFFYFLDTCPSNFVFKLVFNVSCTTISRLRFHPLNGEPSERQLPSLILKIFNDFFFNTQAIVPYVNFTRKISYLYLAFIIGIHISNWLIDFQINASIRSKNMDHSHHKPCPQHPNK